MDEQLSLHHVAEVLGIVLERRSGAAATGSGRWSQRRHDPGRRRQVRDAGWADPGFQGIALRRVGVVGEQLREALWTHSVREASVRVVGDVVLNLLPVADVVPDLTAPSAERQEAGQRLDVLQRLA